MHTDAYARSRYRKAWNSREDCTAPAIHRSSSLCFSNLNVPRQTRDPPPFSLPSPSSFIRRHAVYRISAMPHPPILFSDRFCRVIVAALPLRSLFLPDSTISHVAKRKYLPFNDRKTDSQSTIAIDSQSREIRSISFPRIPGDADKSIAKRFLRVSERVEIDNDITHTTPTVFHYSSGDHRWIIDGSSVDHRRELSYYNGDGVGIGNLETRSGVPVSVLARATSAGYFSNRSRSRSTAFLLAFA